MHLRDNKMQTMSSPIYRQELNFHQDEEEEGSEQGTDFQKTNQIFVLNSKVNELNFFIQKMALQHEEKLSEEKNFIQYLKNQHQKRQQTLQLEYQKSRTIAQAQKTAKSMLTKQIKAIKNDLEQIKRAFDMPVEINSENFILQITKKQNRMKQLQKNNEKLHFQFVQLKKQLEERQKDTISQFQQNSKRQNQRLHSKTMQFEAQKLKYLSQIKQKTKIIDECNKKIVAMESFQSQYRKTLKKYQQQHNLCVRQQEQLSSLRTKQQLLSITKQKYQEGKLKLDEYIEEMTFKLGLQRKKLDMVEARLVEQKQKSLKLQIALSNNRQQLRNAQEKIVNLEENIQELQQKLSVFNVYKEKQRASMSSITQLQQKNRELSNNLKQYELKMQSIQNQLLKTEETKRGFQKMIKKHQLDIQQKQKEITLYNLKLNSQEDVIKELKSQILKVKSELDSVKREKVLKKTSYLGQTNHQSFSKSDRLMWQRMNEQLINHYQKILEFQDKTRIQLQQQIQNLNKGVCQLKNQLNENKKETNQLRQQRELLVKQNKRLLESIINNNKVHQKRVLQIRQKFRDIKESTQVIRLSNSKSQKSLRILNCYNFCQQTQGVNQLTPKGLPVNDSRNTEQKDSKTKSGQENSNENALKRLVKYGSSDNFTDKYRSTQAGFEEKSCDLDASIKLYRERNNSMRLQLNI